MAQKTVTKREASKSKAVKVDVATIQSLREIINQGLVECTAHELRPMQARSRKRVAEIRKAAIAIFARDGIAAARMADVAERADVPVSSIYEHFPSKDDLAQSTLVAGMATFFSTLLEKSEGASTAHEYLKLFLQSTIETPWQDPDWARVFHLEVWPSAIVGEGRVRQAIDWYRKILLEIFRVGAELGEWPQQTDAYQTALILTGSLHQLMISWLLYREPVNLRKAATPLIARLLRFLEIN